MPHILDMLADRVLLCDGGFGSRVQAMTLDLDRDFEGKENCTEILNRSRPDVVRDIHRSYFSAGADCVQTNSFGGSPLTLEEFQLAGDAEALNRRAAELAREVAEEFTAADGAPRFVLGSIGPGTRLPSLGHIGYQSLEEAFTVQATGLVAGGVDAILVETCQDPLQVKAAVNGVKQARAAAGSGDMPPVFVQVTVETTGTLLVGTDIAAAATVIHALDVPLIGLNCATGPQEMAEHVGWLSANWPGLISVQPNAGLPEVVDGAPHYPLGGPELATWHERFIQEQGVALVGGCCGTNIEHIQAIDAMLRRLAGGDRRPRPLGRTVHWVPAVASLYSQVPLRQENAYFSIGERCNANGSKKFRELQEAEDWVGCVDMGRQQIGEGSHALDICTAFVGRQEVPDMTEVVSRMRGSADAPLVIDSTELPVLEAALSLYGGKAILNSVNFEDGEEPAAQRLRLAKRFGAAVVALTIDETGMAKTAEQKLAIARRLYDFAVNRHGLAPSDLLFDPLTFTICTGNEDDRRLAIETLKGIERIAAALPDCQIMLGLSNISFGLNPAARHVLNSVFLQHALDAGMTGAIVHISKIQPLHTIPEEERQVAEDLIFDRRREGYDPLQRLMELFAGRKTRAKTERKRADTVEERLRQRIVDGDRQGLEEDLALAMESWAPLDIINTLLLDGMKVVGELFGAGKMQLPFVLQSAETMKTAVAFLEPHMDKADGQEKGILVLATVKGDVHDIGKNLVDIILSNNGYKVVNLGIKQPISAILDAVSTHRPHAVGLSGLLVKSTLIMKENLEEMTRQGMEVPVMLGGAALTRRFVEEECAAAYGNGRVAYARDAFDGLDLMNKIAAGTFDHDVGTQQLARARHAGRRRRGPGTAGETVRWTPEQACARRQSNSREVPVPVPPFWGPRRLDEVAVKALVPFLNEMSLYQLQWGFRKQGRRKDAFEAYAAKELKPILNRMLDLVQEEAILQPQGVYGYWKCAGSGDDLVLFAEDGEREVARFSFPRQAGGQNLCIADFFRDITATERDVVALQAVTMGHKPRTVAEQWYAANRYQDYLYLHGLSVEMAEAFAEYLHKRIRAELGFAGQEGTMAELLHQGYRGSRYSFGYPACPDLAPQKELLSLLGADAIGLSLTEEDELVPEQSTTAIVATHPAAKYFS